MATEKWVIRLSRVDQDNQPILVHISRKPDGQTLDLDLLATDGESAYRGKVRDKKLDKLRATGYEGAPEEWSSILHHILLPSPSTHALISLPESLRDTLDVKCAVAGTAKKPVLSIVVRQSVQEISHKFGSLQLVYSDDTDDVDLFGWASEVAEERDQLAAKLRTSNTRIEEAAEVIKSLQLQLQDLITAKEEHESQLLSKCAELINEKKLRIRSLQSQLASQQTPSMSKTVANARRTRKRKKPDNVTPDDASESEGFDTMDVDQIDDANEDLSDAARATSDDDGDDDDDDDDDDNTASEPEVQNSPASRPEQSSSKDGATASLPPPRELPFGIKSKPRDNRSLKEITSNVPSGDEETASEDDEL